jgi:hypothetical protein
MNIDQWRTRVLELHPTAQFTQEDGTGVTYGEKGSWTAHTGPDMQADIVGVFVPPFTDGAFLYSNGMETDHKPFCWFTKPNVPIEDVFEEHEAE